jgi:O-antigen/teichoic acid export membrane protein
MMRVPFSDAGPRADGSVDGAVDGAAAGSLDLGPAAVPEQVVPAPPADTSPLRVLVAASALYGLGGVATAVLGLLSVPVFTRTLPPSQYGRIGLITALLFLLGVVLVLGLDDATQRWYGLTADEVDRKTTFGTWIWTQLSVSALAAVAMLLAAKPLAGLLVGDAGASSALRWAALCVPLGSLRTVTVNWLRMQQRAGVAATYGVVVAASCTTASVVLVGVAHQGVSGFFAGQVIGLSAAAVFSCALMRSWLRPAAANLRRLRVMAVFALPLVPTAVGIWVINLLDRYIIDAIDGTGAVGRYQIAYAVAGLAALVTTAFQMAWMPYAYHRATRPDAADVFARSFLGYVAVCGGTAALVSMFAPEIVNVIAPASYRGAIDAVPALAFSYVFIGLTYIAMTGPSLRGVTTPIAVATLVAAAATVALDVTLIPWLGVTGASIATLLAWMTQPAWLFWRSSRLLPVRYDYGRATILLVGAAIVAVAGIAMHDAPLSWMSAAKVPLAGLLLLGSAVILRGER